MAGTLQMGGRGGLSVRLGDCPGAEVASVNVWYQQVFEKATMTRGRQAGRQLVNHSHHVKESMTMQMPCGILSSCRLLKDAISLSLTVNPKKRRYEYRLPFTP